MKKQSLIILVVIVLLTSTMMLGYFFKASKRAARVQSTAVLKTIGAKIEVEDIGAIQINDMRLEHDADEYSDWWEYEDTEKNLTIVAWRERVEAFLKDVKNFSQGRIVEANPSDIAKYGLAESEEKDKAPYIVTLESKSGKNILSFAFSQTTDPAYARFEDDKAVYKVASTLHSTLSSETIYWLDTRIFTPNVAPTLEIDEVSFITISPRDGTKMVLGKDLDDKKKKSKKDEDTAEWTLANAALTLDNTKVSQYLNALLEAKAKDFSDVQVVDSMKESEVLIKTKDGTEVGLTLYAFAENFYVKKKTEHENDFNQYTFLITKYLKETLFPTSAEPFVAEPPVETQEEAETKEETETEEEKKTE